MHAASSRDHRDSITSHTFPETWTGSWKTADLIFVQSLFYPFSLRVVYDQVVNHFTMHDLFSLVIGIVLDILPRCAAASACAC